MRSTFSTTAARGLAHLLTGAWHAKMPPLAIDAAQLETLMPSFLQSGAAALIYWRVRHSPLRHADVAQPLRAEYWAQAARTPRRLHEIQEVIGALAAAGIEPLLFKGWAIARHYPELPLRPFTDIDLFVRPAELVRAERAVNHLQLSQLGVDWHTQTQDPRHATHLADRTLDELYTHAQRVVLDQVTLHVLSAEDHLHLLALHCLRHGAWQPLWLVDLAVALETRPRDFDWARCLGTRRAADYIACACGLAHHLLGARLNDTPLAGRAKNLPRWLVPAVLAQWARAAPELHFPSAPLRRVWKKPAQLLSAVRARWVDPLQAAMLLEDALDESPRPLAQARYFWRQGADFVLRALRSSKHDAPPA